MGRRAYALGGRALQAAAEWRRAGARYEDIARLLVRCHLVDEQADAATVRRHLVAAGLAERQRRQGRRPREVTHAVR